MKNRQCLFNFIMWELNIYEIANLDISTEEFSNQIISFTAYRSKLKMNKFK